jgi:diaminohydroxyphosphoribosylaminopyrimidine deaminase/5-amino-6-(5-phosphoribosylamino)uracil reductase
MTNHEALMRRAMHMANTARLYARPNPWVGAVVVCVDGSVFEGATQPPGGPHAEIVALTAAREAGADVRGATLYSTLEPCSHTGRTGPCTTAIIDAEIAHVVVGITDPDDHVSGDGLAALHRAGITVTEDVCADEVTQQLQPYLHHRRTGRPFVMLKMASTLDARTTIPNGPRWITGDVARERVHQLRAESDAILVGAATVREDNPVLTVRNSAGASPRRIVLSRSGDVPVDALVHPCTVWTQDIDLLLDTLGADGFIQLMVEGGPTVATEFHDRGLINRYVFHIAPVVTGSDTAPGVFTHDTHHALTDCRLVSATALGADLEIVLEPVTQKVDSQ